MDDLISRQQAIRWVKTECNPYGKPTIDFESGKKVIDHLEQMPPAQPNLQPTCNQLATDTISRQAAIDRFNVIRPVDPKKDEYTKGIDVGIAMCIVAVKDQPSAQPESGRWIYTPGMNEQCSACGQYFPLSYFKDRPFDIKYCPHCGAYMRGEKDE